MRRLRERFARETKEVLPEARSPIEAMIDKASGRTADVLRKFVETCRLDVQGRE